jgi:hypothetical protein
VQQASPAITDTEFGATTNTTFSDFVLWARTSWNGDTTNLYNCNFDLMNVQWTWFDMDELESNGHVSAARSTAVVKMNPITRFVAADGVSGQFGGTGERWLHFANISTFCPRTPGAGNALIECGSSTDGTPATWQGEQIYGKQSRGMLFGTGVQPHRQAMQFIWHDVVPVGGYRRAVQATDTQTTVALQCESIQSTMLSIRVDVLTALGFYTNVGNVPNISPSSTLPGALTYNLPAELPEQTGLTAPVLFGCSQWGDNSSEACKAVLVDNTNQAIRDPSGYAYQDGTVGESSIALTIAQQTLAPAGVRSFKFAGLRNANDVLLKRLLNTQLLMVNPVYQPSNVPTGTWIEPNPVTLQIGREGTTIGFLNDLPIEPNTARPIDVVPMRRASIRGKQRYSRTWPLWQKARRTWQLTWGPINSVQGKTLSDFLDANTSFRLTPQHGRTVLPVVQSGDRATEYLGDGRQIVSLKIVELIYVV